MAKYLKKMGKNTVVESPVGELEWVIVGGQGKLNTLNDKYYYQATLVLDSESQECKDFIAEIDQFFEDEADKKMKKKNKKSTGYAPHKVRTGEDEDGDPIYEETGKTAFMFKTETTFKDGNAKTIGIHNAKGARVALGNRKIGNGSVGRINGVIKTYDQVKDTGTSLYLNAVQLVKYIPFADGPSFDSVEDEVDAEEAFEGFEDDGDMTPAEEPSKDDAPSKPRL